MFRYIHVNIKSKFNNVMYSCCKLIFCFFIIIIIIIILLTWLSCRPQIYSTVYVCEMSIVVSIGWKVIVLKIVTWLSPWIFRVCSAASTAGAADTGNEALLDRGVYVTSNYCAYWQHTNCLI